MQSTKSDQQQVTIDDIRQKLPLSIFPQHDPQRFSIARDEKQITKVYEAGDDVGFMILGDETFYELDDDFGFFEPNGCYYNAKMQPAGWWIKDRKNVEHFYNFDGYLEAIEEVDIQENDTLTQQQQIKNNYKVQNQQQNEQNLQSEGTSGQENKNKETIKVSNNGYEPQQEEKKKQTNDHL